MPELVEVNAEPREVVGKKVKALRNAGKVPGIIYGVHAVPQPIQIDERALGRFLAHSGGSALLNINVRGEASPRPAIIRDAQRDPITQRLLHIDFLQVSLTEKVATSVPVVLVGEAPAVVEGHGTLIQGITSVNIECLPTDIPDEIAVDVSGLAEVDQSITVGDIAPPEGVEIQDPPEQMVVRVVLEREEEEFEEVPTAELEEVEIVGEGQVEAVEETAEEAEEDE